MSEVTKVAETIQAREAREAHRGLERQHERKNKNPFDTRHEDRARAKAEAEAAPLTKEEAVDLAKQLRPDQGRDRMLRFLGADPTTSRNISDGRENRPAEAVRKAEGLDRAYLDRGNLGAYANPGDRVEAEHPVKHAPDRPLV